MRAILPVGVPCMLIALIVLAVVAVLIVGFLWSVYNGLVKARINVKEAWAGIDVQSKRRSSLIQPRRDGQGLCRARARDARRRDARPFRLDSATGPADAALADNMLTQALGRLFAVTEAYPDLKANQNFLELQRELTDTEDNISLCPPVL